MDIESKIKNVSISAQPLFDLKSYKVIGYEIFSEHVISLYPRSFAEEKINFYLNSAEILERVLSKCKISKGIKLTLNINENEIMTPSLIGSITVVLKKYSFPANDLVLEISEKFSSASLTTVSTILNSLKEIGIAIALDDYGAGRKIAEQILSYLPFSIIKIDKMFLSSTSRASAVCMSEFRKHIELARKLNYQTILEGIENTDDLKVAEDFGIDIGQGYFFGLPRNIDEFKNNDEVM
jgi:EAL domain-containing protein (putative c-di-GMP-specific phosphodiesterase class I)